MNKNEYIIKANSGYHVYISQIAGRYGINFIYPICSIRSIIIWPFNLLIFITYNIICWFVHKGGRIMMSEEHFDALRKYKSVSLNEYRIVSCMTLDIVPPIEPCNEIRDFPENFNDLIVYDPPFGHEYGFNNQGLRYDYNIIDVPIEEKYTIDELSEHVDALVWSNLDSYNCTYTEMEHKNTNSLRYFGNIAYVSLYHSNQKIRDDCLHFLKCKYF